MPDLANRLQSVLGSAYHVERELGGGGMSRVFLAEEVALRRRVVVKVLPPEMSAGVSADRFRREIQLAASLQHPHIVPLLTAGSAEDMLFYVMPYIEGESLRARLAHDRELPIPDAIRILRDVVDALAAAHVRGVVHRDIKPDNVLLSGRHAVVTDFGVAKAVTDSTKGSGLTSLGVALGTPAYMAPEQAAADPNVDHRADIYAVGVLAYEMLCGRPPFQMRSPQELLAAHVTIVPEPCLTHRATVPAALNALVMQCLAKKPADRPQTAEELVVLLSDMAASSGAIPPTGAIAVSSGTEQAISLHHPMRVTAVAGAAALTALGLVWLIVRFVGVPLWVKTTAIAIIVVAVPAVVITGRTERRRLIEKSTGAVRSRESEGVRRHITWGRTLATLGVAFGVLAVVAAAYLSMRALGIGPVGSLMAKGLLTSRDRILIATFDNRTADTTLGSTVTELLRTDLSQSRSVSVYDPAQLGAALARLGLPRNAHVSFDVAKEVATRDGLKAVLAGDVSTVGSGYVLAARLVAVKTGDVLWASRETAANADALLPAVDKLSADLRERVGESLRHIQSDPPLEELTTSSTEALRLFAQASHAQDIGKQREALPLLERALQVDSNFGMAHRKLAIILYNTGNDTARQNAHFRRAYALRGGMSVRERLLAEAAYANYVAHDTASAMSAYESLLADYPDDRVAGRNLGSLYERKGRRQDALRVFKNSIHAGNAAATTFGGAMNLVTTFEGLDSTLAVLNAFEAAFPENPDVARFQISYLQAIGQYDSVGKLLDAKLIKERTYCAACAKPTDGPSYSTLSDLQVLAELRGKLGLARKLEVESRAALRKQCPTCSGFGLDSLQREAFLTLLYMKDTSAARELKHRAVAATPLPGPKARPYEWARRASQFAEAGLVDSAKFYLAKWEAAVPDSVRKDPTAYPTYVLRHIAIAERRYADALSDLRTVAARSQFCDVECWAGDFAALFLAMGQSDSAIKYMEMDLEGKHRLYFRGNAITHERLASLFEQRGDTAKAIREWEKFADMWKDADAVLQPRVRAARARIAALKPR